MREGGLNEGRARLARAKRALAFSGRRLIERDDGWAVMAGADRRRRPVVRLSDGEARELIAGGRVKAARGGGFIGCDVSDVTEMCAAQAELGDAVFVAVGVSRRQGCGPGFAGLARRAARGDGPLSLRQAQAGLRLIADAEARGREAGLTMNWEGVPADRVRRRAGPGGRAFAARAAALRLERVARGVGVAVWTLAWAACVERLSIAQLEQRFGYRAREGGERLSEALEALAGAYEGR